MASAKKQKALDIDSYPQKWRDALFAFVGRSDSGQSLKDWCESQGHKYSTANRYLTKSAIACAEKRGFGTETEKIRTESAPDITPKQKAFVDHYVTDFNATNAAKKAGYSEHTAMEQGHQLLRKASVRSAVDRRVVMLSESAMIDAEAMLEYHARIAFANLGDFVKWGGQEVSLIDSKDLSPEQLGVVGEVSVGKDGVKLKLKSPSQSMAHLTKVLDAKTSYERNLLINTLDALKAGEITPVEAGLQIERQGVALPYTLQRQIDAELRLTELDDAGIQIEDSPEAEEFEQAAMAYYRKLKEDSKGGHEARMARIEKSMKPPESKDG